MSVDIFNQLVGPYRNTEEPSETLYTVVIHDLSSTAVVDAINHRLGIVNMMHPSKKKATAGRRLHMFREHIQLQETTLSTSTIINKIFLINDSIVAIPLHKTWLDILHEYDITKFIFKYECKFAINYLYSLLIDTTYKHVIHVKNNTYTHIHLNSTKKKTVMTRESKQFDLLGYIKEVVPAKNKCLVHGVSGVLKNLRIEPHWVFPSKLEDQEILEIYRKDEIQQIHIKLEAHMSYMKQDKYIHRLVFGSDIDQQLNDQTLEFLYCSPQAFLSLMPDAKQYNTTIYEVESLQKGDAGDRLALDFAGRLGVTYY